MLAALGTAPTATLSELFDSWSDIVGTAIASTCAPLALEHGTLTVAVPDGGWASQLRWMERELLAKFDATLGAGVVTAIRVRVKQR